MTDKQAMYKRDYSLAVRVSLYEQKMHTLSTRVLARVEIPITEKETSDAMPSLVSVFAIYF